MIEIHIIDALHVEQNYNYVLRDEASGKTAVVDASDAEPILAFLSKKRWGLDYILTTHHHWDHVSGIPKLLKKTDAQVVGYAGDAERIPHISIQLEEGESFVLGESEAEVLFIPGHTLGHIAYYFEADKLLFPGDTLFSIGCGRVFEGTMEQMYHSLQTLAALPDNVQLYCGHEYTEANLRFAMAVEPDNAALSDYAGKVQEFRAQGKPSIPSMMAIEKELNPFLRAESAEAFAKLRAHKDRF